ncbi:hypothetical protein GCM10022215_18250 [Nocardioides fonticola]|uniref:HNH nuclease domain-containing protein n=1 Tax=Nocardioides fonticola TaxID=450363 RepID=A0ABP7XIF5_9ACTN
MWFKLDDKFHEWPEIHDLLVPPDRDPEALDELLALAAVGLYALTGSWSGDQLSDGVIPEHVLRRWAPTEAPKLTRLLRAAGLWKPHDPDKPRRVVFTRWAPDQPLRADVEADRLAAKTRQAFYRDKALKAAIDERDQDRCRYCGTLVNWTDKRSAGGGTYDHVVPIVEGGRNTLENVVVCCRGCNGRKGGRSLTDAGMKLLKAGSLGAPVIDAPTSATADRDDPDASLADDHTPGPVTRNTGVLIGSGRVGSGAENVPGVSPSTATTTDHATTTATTDPGGDQ